MNEFWQRSVKVNFVPTNGDPFSVTDLKITFQVQKQSGIEPNTGKIIIFNMNPTHRGAVSWKFDIHRQSYGGTVEVIAGYGDNPKQVFKGDIVQAINTKVGPDWVTTIEGMTGVQAIASGTVNKTHPAGTENKSILKGLLDEIDGVGIKKEVKGFIDNIMGSSKTKKSQSLIGSLSDVVQKMNDKFSGKLAISIDESGIKVTPPGVANSDKKLYLSQGSGLLETPEITNVGVNIKTLLLSEIRSGSPINIKSGTIDSLGKGGDYVVEKVTHNGDSRQGEFVSNLVCLFPVENLAAEQ